ncbi:MAG: VWA domain-containing protein [Pyrinomonadaceae bacterium]
MRTDEVVLPVSVRDATGQPVNGLKQGDFIVFENGVRQEIASFNRERLSANIVLLMDASGSVFEHMRLIREAAKEFMNGLMASDRVCVMQFSDSVELLQDWTPATETATLNKAVQWRYHPGLSTTFYDGLYISAQEQLGKVSGRKIVILLTDGIDTAKQQRASFADALNAVRRQETSVYVVSLTAILRSEIEQRTEGKLRRIFSGYDPRLVSRYLKMIEDSETQLTKLAEQTGGRIFLPTQQADLTTAYRAIAEELRTQYIVTYKPRQHAPAGEWRRVRVLVSPGGYEVATREGYTGRG